MTTNNSSLQESKENVKPDFIKVKHEQMTTLLKQVIGEQFKLDGRWRGKYEGVEFHALHSGDVYGIASTLTGIQMQVGDYGNSIIRRIMVKKDGTIDANAIRTKFAELKKAAERIEIIRKEYQVISDKRNDCFMRVAKAIGYSRDDAIKGFWVLLNTETSVRMESSVTGSQLLALEKILGTQKVNVNLVVPEDKAVEVYNILKGSA